MLLISTGPLGIKLAVPSTGKRSLIPQAGSPILVLTPLCALPPHLSLDPPELTLPGDKLGAQEGGGAMGPQFSLLPLLKGRHSPT